MLHIMVWAVDVTFSRSVSLSYVRTRHTVYMPPLLPFCIVCVPQLLPLVALLFCIICVPLRKILGKGNWMYVHTYMVHACRVCAVWSAWGHVWSKVCPLYRRLGRKFCLSRPLHVKWYAMIAYICYSGPSFYSCYYIIIHLDLAIE